MGKKRGSSRFNPNGRRAAGADEDKRKKGRVRKERIKAAVGAQAESTERETLRKKGFFRFEKRIGVAEVTFDEHSRRDFITGFQRRKSARRAMAVQEAEEQAKKARLEERAALRKEREAKRKQREADVDAFAADHAATMAPESVSYQGKDLIQTTTVETLELT